MEHIFPYLSLPGSQQKVQGHHRTIACLNLDSPPSPLSNPPGKLRVELKCCHTDPCG